MAFLFNGLNQLLFWFFIVDLNIVLDTKELLQF
jgi:hypothetical protein